MSKIRSGDGCSMSVVSESGTATLRESTAHARKNRKHRRPRPTVRSARLPELSPVQRYLDLSG